LSLLRGVYFKYLSIYESGLLKEWWYSCSHNTSVHVCHVCTAKNSSLRMVA